MKLRHSLFLSSIFVVCCSLLVPYMPVAPAEERSTESATRRPLTIDKTVFFDPSAPIVEIIGPENEIKEGWAFVVKIRTPHDLPADRVKTKVSVSIPDGAVRTDLKGENGERVLFFAPAVRGEYRFDASAQISVDMKDGFDPVGFESLLVRVGDKTPDPEPDPDPDPDPEPEPDPNPIPITERGLRVLILEETQDRAKLPPELLLAMSSSEVAQYIKDRRDGEPNYRLLSDDLDQSEVERLPELWQNAYKFAMDAAEKYAKDNALPTEETDEGRKLPWLLISNGDEGWSGPFEDVNNAVGFRELLKQYGD